MTTVYVFSVRDVVSNNYGSPFVSINEGTAVRSVASEVNSGQRTAIAENPDDFELYGLGQFDDETGLINVSVAPVLICRCSSLVKRSEPISAAN